MRAATVTAFGGPEHLKVADVPTPDIGPGQVRIEVEVVGVGLSDILIRRGTVSIPTFTVGYVPGGEVVGKVVAVADDVEESWIGKRVHVLNEERAGCAEFVASNASDLVVVPAELSSEEAVAVGVTGLVAHFALLQGGVKAGDEVLIRGAGGGIGVMTTQLAAHRGAKVTVSTASVERGNKLLELGASEVVDRSGRTADGKTKVYDVIIDPVAGPETNAFVDMLGNRGRMVLIGIAGGFPPPEFGMGIFRNFANCISLSMMSLQPDAPGRKEALEENLALTASGVFKPMVDEVFPLDDIISAHRKVEAAGSFGKVILRVSDLSY